MFTKIDIKKFGLYKDFTWNPGKMKDFDQVNIIYGRNWKNRRTLTLCASFQLTHENFCFLTRMSVLAGGSFLFCFVRT